MLKRQLDAEAHAALAEPLQELYIKGNDGSFTLQIEADPAVAGIQKQLAEFRENNVKLANELSEAKKPTIRPEDMSLADRVDELTEQLKAEREKRETAEGRSNEATLQQKLMEVGKKHGLAATAAPDLMERARRAGFTVEDGAIVARSEDGAPATRSDGTPLTLSAWVAEQRNGPGEHLFGRPSGSGGAGAGFAGSDGAGGAAKVLLDPTTAQLTANAAAIASGEVEVQSSEPGRAY